MGTYESAPNQHLQTAPPDLQVLDHPSELPATPNETAPQDSGDFYTPEQARGEVIDFPTQEGMGELEETLSPEALEAIEQLEAAYPELYRDATLTELAEASQAETLELLDEAREELGLTQNLEEADPESLERMQDTLEELRPAYEAIQKQVNALEQIALELPEELKTQLEKVERQKQQMKIELDAEMNEFLEAASRLQRELAVRGFIQDSIRKMAYDNADLFTKAENGKAATEIMAAQISSGVWEAAQTFIQKGGRPDYGFHLDITFTSHEDEDGNEKIFITEIELEIRGATRVDGGRHEEEAA